MSIPPVRKRKPAFGHRSEPHTVTITKGSKTRNFTVHPVHFTTICSVVALFMLAYLGATAYLVLRDDLIGATLAKQARLQHQYEDRIAALRSRIDLITSQQLIEQQVVETRVQELVNRQAALGSRTGVFGSVLQKAAVIGLTPAKVAVPKLRPQAMNSDGGTDPVTTGSIGKSGRLRLGALSGTKSPFSSSIIDLAKPDPGNKTTSFSYLQAPDGVFANVENSLINVEAQQIITLKELRATAIRKTKRIAGILKKIGVSLPVNTTKNIGGPLIELDNKQRFGTHITALDTALNDLKRTRSMVARLPVGSPVPGQTTSSRYGRRIDPILHRAAMHAGLDFRARKGHPVRATGAGKVVKAGYNGGYGRMVEISHGNGLTTRFAHMSRILVKVGQNIRAGKIVGKVGSTGRSTGPHLHYEIRHRGKAQNPARYVRAGAKLKSLL